MNQNIRENNERQAKEEYAIILDVLINNQSFKDSEVAQAIGTTSYTLLELVPKAGVILKTGQRVYIGEDKREEIQYIKRAITEDKLSGSARTELLFTLTEIVQGKEDFFVNFINTAGPITIRKHSLESIPGIGKKHLRDLLDERDSKPFENFENIKERCHFLADPAKSIAQKILNEIEGTEEFKIFVRR